MRLADLLGRLAAATPTPNSLTQGCNSHGGNMRFHLAHPNGTLLGTLKTIAEEAPALLQELKAALPAADLPGTVAEVPTAPIVAPEAAAAPAGAQAAP